MWLLGTIIVLVAGAALTTALGWTPRAKPSLPIWDIAKQGSGNAGSASAFAGFSLAAATFIAGLDVARTPPAFATVFGMMLVGFLILVAASWIGGSMPNMPGAENADVQSLALVLGNMCGALGVSITWLALTPLQEAIGLPTLYRLLAARAWPTLWPADQAALHFVFVALGAAGLMFAIHLGFIGAYDNPRVR